MSKILTDELVEKARDVWFTALTMNGVTDEMAARAALEAVLPDLTAAERAAGRMEGEIAGWEGAKKVCKAGRFREDAQAPGAAVVFHVVATCAEIDRRLLALRSADKTGDGTI